MDGSFQSVVSQSYSAGETDSQNLWDSLQEFFGENPQNFYQVLSVISDAQKGSLKMFKAINQVKDEMVAVQELSVHRDESEKLMRLVSFDSSKQQESEIRVFDKYLFSKSNEVAVLWLEMEYCQMGTLHEIQHITKLAFSQGEIAFMLSQIFVYLIADRERAEETHLGVRPLLDSKHIFLTNQGVLKLFPFPLFSQSASPETPRRNAINNDLISLIALMDNNKHGREENYSEDLRDLVNDLRNGESYENLLSNSKIICENRSRFEYIKRSIFSTRKRSMENYRKRSISQFVPDTLKKLNDSQKQVQNVSSSSRQSKSKQEKRSRNSIHHGVVLGKQQQQVFSSNGMPIVVSAEMNSFKIPRHFCNAASSALSQDLKDISQISLIHSGYLSLGSSDGASLGSNGITSQLLSFSKYSFTNTNTNAIASPRVDAILEQQENLGVADENVNISSNIVQSKLNAMNAAGEQGNDVCSNSQNQVIEKVQVSFLASSLVKVAAVVASQTTPSNVASSIIKRFFENHPEKKKFKVRRFSRENKLVSDSSSSNQSNQSNPSINFSLTCAGGQTTPTTTNSSPCQPPLLPLSAAAVVAAAPAPAAAAAVVPHIPTEIPEEMSQEITFTQSFLDSPVKKKQSTTMESSKSRKLRYSPKTECLEMQQIAGQQNSIGTQNVIDEIHKTSIESSSSYSSSTSLNSFASPLPASPRGAGYNNNSNNNNCGQEKKNSMPLIRSHSDEIDVFTLKEYMMHKRNSSPVSRQQPNIGTHKKTESPKLEKPYSHSLSPVGAAIPPTLLSFDSSIKREPFSIKRLLQKPLNNNNDEQTPVKESNSSSNFNNSYVSVSNRDYFCSSSSSSSKQNTQKHQQQQHSPIQFGNFSHSNRISSHSINGSGNNNGNSALTYKPIFQRDEILKQKPQSISFIGRIGEIGGGASPMTTMTNTSLQNSQSYFSSRIPVNSQDTSATLYSNSAGKSVPNRNSKILQLFNNQFDSNAELSNQGSTQPQQQQQQQQNDFTSAKDTKAPPSTSIRQIFGMNPLKDQDFSFIKNNLFESTASSNQQNNNSSYSNAQARSPISLFKNSPSRESSALRRQLGFYQGENNQIFQSGQIAKEGSIGQVMPATTAINVGEDKIPQHQYQQQSSQQQQQRRCQVFASVSSTRSRSNSPFSISSATTTSQHSRHQSTVVGNNNAFVKMISHANNTNNNNMIHTLNNVGGISPFDSRKSSIQSPSSISVPVSSQSQFPLQPQQQQQQLSQQLQQSHLKSPLILSPMRRKYGKDLTHRFNEAGQYIETKESKEMQQQHHHRCTSGQIFGSATDMYDSFSTTDSNGRSLQVKGISLLAKQSSLHLQHTTSIPSNHTILQLQQQQQHQQQHYQQQQQPQLYELNHQPISTGVLTFTDFCFP